MKSCCDSKISTVLAKIQRACIREISLFDESNLIGSHRPQAPIMLPYTIERPGTRLKVNQKWGLGLARGGGCYVCHILRKMKI